MASPLIVDPITTCTFIGSLLPDADNSDIVIVWFFHSPRIFLTPAFDRRTVIVVDLSEIPGGSTIDAASKLEFYCLLAYSAEAATVYRITQAGVTEAATWNRYDGVNAWATPGGDYSLPFAQFTSPAAAGWLTITGAQLAALFQDALDNRDKVARMLIKMDDEDGTFEGSMLASDDDVNDPSRKPKATIVYAEEAPAGPFLRPTKYLS